MHSNFVFDSIDYRGDSSRPFIVLPHSTCLPAPGMEAEFLEGTDNAYGGPITLGVDGTLISLQADGDMILESNRVSPIAFLELKTGY